jgi:hypothetical protein
MESQTLEFGEKDEIKIAIKIETQSKTKQELNEREIKKSDLEHELESRNSQNKIEIGRL